MQNKDIGQTRSARSAQMVLLNSNVLLTGSNEVGTNVAFLQVKLDHCVSELNMTGGADCGSQKWH